MADVFERVMGPEPYRVYQRDSSGAAAIHAAGEVVKGAEGILEMRLTTGKECVSGFDWRGWALCGSSFNCSLADVPEGGPYTLELRIRQGAKTSAVRRISGILVGDLWILAGQSNMDGCGKLVNLEPPSQHVNCFYYGDRWQTAKDPLCWLNESTDPVHWFQQDVEARAAAVRWERIFRETGAGLGVRFGKDLFKATGVPVGLIVCSHGGTSMEQWNPALKDRGGESLYGCLIRRVCAVGGKVAGCLWYQGESDALSEGWKTYDKAFRGFIESLRSDLGQSDLPFIYVQLSRFFSDDLACRDGWNKVQNDQLLIESQIDRVAFASAVDCSLSDAIHIDALSQRKMGARLAKLARRLVFGHGIETGPRPDRVELSGDERKGIRVSFRGVNARLGPRSGIRGFLVEKDNVPVGIARCGVGSDGKSIDITLTSPAPEGAVLWYGRGINPTCNLSDAAGFPAPVFGPVVL